MITVQIVAPTFLRPRYPPQGYDDYEDVKLP